MKNPNSQSLTERVDTGYQAVLPEIRRRPDYELTIDDLNCRTQIDVAEQERKGVPYSPEKFSRHRNARAERIIQDLRDFREMGGHPSIESQNRYSAMVQALVDEGFDPYKQDKPSTKSVLASKDASVVNSRRYFDGINSNNPTEFGEAWGRMHEHYDAPSIPQNKNPITEDVKGGKY